MSVSRHGQPQQRCRDRVNDPGLLYRRVYKVRRRLRVSTHFNEFEGSFPLGLVSLPTRMGIRCCRPLRRWRGWFGRPPLSSWNATPALFQRAYRITRLGRI